MYTLHSLRGISYVFRIGKILFQEKRQETSEEDDGDVLKQTVLLACDPTWFTFCSLGNRFLQVMCNKWRDLTALYPLIIWSD